MLNARFKIGSSIRDFYNLYVNDKYPYFSDEPSKLGGRGRISLRKSNLSV